MVIVGCSDCKNCNDWIGEKLGEDENTFDRCVMIAHELNLGRLSKGRTLLDPYKRLKV